ALRLAGEIVDVPPVAPDGNADGPGLVQSGHGLLLLAMRYECGVRERPGLERNGQAAMKEEKARPATRPPTRGPEPAQAAGCYREVPAPPALRRHFGRA